MATFPMKTCLAVFCIRLPAIFCASVNTPLHILLFNTSGVILFCCHLFFPLRISCTYWHWSQRHLPHSSMAIISSSHYSIATYWAAFCTRTFSLFLVFCYFKQWFDDSSVHASLCIWKICLWDNFLEIELWAKAHVLPNFFPKDCIQFYSHRV